MSVSSSNPSVQAALAALSKLFIYVGHVYEHAPVLTSEEHEKALGQVDGSLAKNMFIKDKKGKYFLLTVRHDRQFDLKALGKLIGASGDVRFADEKALDSLLKVPKGSVTPLALLNDEKHEVILILDKALSVENDAKNSKHLVYVHPLTNSATIALTVADLDKFIKSTTNEFKILDLKPAFKESSASSASSSSASASSSSSSSASSSSTAAAKSKAPAVERSKEKSAKEEKKEEGDEIGLQYEKTVAQFADWYSQLVTRTELIDYYDISGCYIFRPYSFAIWEEVQSFFDAEIKKLGVKNAYFPMFVPKKHLEREKDHVEGFAPEVAWVTKAGDTDLQEPIAIRPTSETIMYPYYAKWIRSHRDLPLRLNQWTNVVRWEFKYPTPFIRTREFLWQEGHSAFATEGEAGKEVLDILNLYARVYEELLAVPVIKGKKTEVEKFAGGYYTTTVEAFIPVVGRGVQGATSHCLGQNFAKMFDIKYEDDQKVKQLVWQNSWGLTTRTLGVMIMVHSDNKGLVLPPRVAPTQVMVVPIYQKEGQDELDAEVDAVVATLKEGGIRADSDKRRGKNSGWKFNEWDLRGVPVRVELGKKDLEKGVVTAGRRDKEKDDPLKKIQIKRAELVSGVKDLLHSVQTSLYERAKAEATQNRKRVNTWDEFMKELQSRCTVLAPHCDVTECEEAIKKRSAEDSKTQAAEENNSSVSATGEQVQQLTGAAKSLCIPFEQPKLTAGTKCVGCDRIAKHFTLFGRSY